jgi:hypothetical protein
MVLTLDELPPILETELLLSSAKPCNRRHGVRRTITPRTATHFMMTRAILRSGEIRGLGSNSDG